MDNAEFEILVKSKKSEAVDFCRALEQAFQRVIDHATAELTAARDMRMLLERVRPDDDDDY